MGNNKTENTKKQGKREKTAATPNKGKNAGLQTRILEINPKALFVPCANHSLNKVCANHSI